MILPPSGHISGSTYVWDGLEGVKTRIVTALLMLLLKGNNPDKFKDKTAITAPRIKSFDDPEADELAELERDLLTRYEAAGQLPPARVTETTAEMVETRSAMNGC